MWSTQQSKPTSRHPDNSTGTLWRWSWLVNPRAPIVTSVGHGAHTDSTMLDHPATTGLTGPANSLFLKIRAEDGLDLGWNPMGPHKKPPKTRLGEQSGHGVADPVLPYTDVNFPHTAKSSAFEFSSAALILVNSTHPPRPQNSNQEDAQSVATASPVWAKRLLTSREQDTTTAYELQVKGAREGALRWAAYSIALCGLGHVYSPFFRRQTLAFKAFLVSSGSMAGMVIWADHYLLRHERIVRKTDDLMRRQAREDLGRRGIIATESELTKWKKEQLDSLRTSPPSSTSA
ncbi:hypothetical protein CROQUDRAFT_92170 [Cronartium quercuum f. sp. fusiforme G11]|uniref:Uncharacterized protein n=1 Tax=Cronartium quercuum f. sp. fusiforme G11 TaxID=708437 RepID=A0A9P6NH43_9BASI|nr:hypothetical protein CROQUDRAFT_92170 [Cronartium quercuum f. sp. fusiforme G11]